MDGGWGMGVDVLCVCEWVDGMDTGCQWMSTPPVRDSSTLFIERLKTTCAKTGIYVNARRKTTRWKACSSNTGFCSQFSSVSVDREWRVGGPWAVGHVVPSRQCGAEVLVDPVEHAVVSVVEEEVQCTVVCVCRVLPDGACIPPRERSWQARGEARRDV